jgi:hypothetical protein
VPADLQHDLADVPARFHQAVRRGHLVERNTSWITGFTVPASTSGHTFSSSAPRSPPSARPGARAASSP